MKLTDVAPDGTSKWLTDGGPLATHRNSHSKPEPTEMGQIYEMETDLRYVAYLFEKGHRIRLSVASAYFQMPGLSRLDPLAVSLMHSAATQPLA